MHAYIHTLKQEHVYKQQNVLLEVIYISSFAGASPFGSIVDIHRTKKNVQSTAALVRSKNT